MEPPTRILKERFRLDEALAENGPVTTFRATELSTRRSCIVKSFSFRRAEDWKSLELFEREAKALANLRHPRIPKLLDSFTTDDQSGKVFYQVREHVAGTDLAQLVRRGRHFSEPEVVALGLDVLGILDHIHGLQPPLIHRDIKPSNIVVDLRGRAHLIDFGAVRDTLARETGLLGSGATIVGSYGYMPFEQYQGRAMPASDLYSLGATLIFCISHKDPGDLTGEGTALKFRPHVACSEALCRFLEKMVESEWNARYPSAREARLALEQVAFEREAERRAGGRRPAWSILGIAAAGVLTLALLAGVFLRRGSPRPETVVATPPRVAAVATTPAAPAPTVQPTDRTPTPRPSVTSEPTPTPTEDLLPPPVLARRGELRIDLDRDFKFVAAGWPGQLSVGQTEAGGLGRSPFETLHREPRYSSPEVFYGYLRLGNGPDPQITFVVDALERPTWELWVDRNNNEDLTDDGPPVANQGSDRLAAKLRFSIDIVGGGTQWKRPYALWFWINPVPRSDPHYPGRARLYAVCHFTGRVDLDGEVFNAVSFEESGHDALFADAGLFVDLNRDGRYEPRLERFLQDEPIRTARGAWRLVIESP